MIDVVKPSAPGVVLKASHDQVLKFYHNRKAAGLAPKLIPVSELAKEAAKTPAKEKPPAKEKKGKAKADEAPASTEDAQQGEDSQGADSEREALLKICTERGIPVHHRAGVDKIKKAIAAADAAGK